VAQRDITITINTTGTSDEMADHVAEIAELIRDGYVCGHTDASRNWDSNIEA
jgi:hypothetical protein